MPATPYSYTSLDFWPTRDQFSRALAAERAATPPPPTLKILGVFPLPEESAWSVKVSLEEEAATWRDLHEGMRAKWGEFGGGGELLTLNPDQCSLVLAKEDDEVPEPKAGDALKIEDMDFLAPLEALWAEADWQNAMAQACRADLPRPAPHLPAPIPNPSAWFPWLRPGQIDAFSLLELRHSFVWGPAGTGKTRTVGTMVAAWLEKNPGKRVLLVATTNPAVDQLLVAVDQALEELGHGTQGDSPRLSCRRIGRQADRRRYDHRSHLLPKVSEKRESRPSTLHYLANARAVALTSARLLMEAPFVRQLVRPFDLLVIDEASQLPLAHALALLPFAPLGLYAGDPAQLGPVVRAKEKEAKAVLGRSLFDVRPHLGDSARTVLLSEQSRMAEPICDVVGRNFYEGRLRVCARAAADLDWQARRESARGPRPAFEVVPVDDPGRFSRSRGGPIRDASVVAVVAHVQALLAANTLRPVDILVLTPFRAQQRLLRDALLAAQMGAVKVMTVHRAQGSERLAVLFDPVDERSPFLRGPEGARLVNVALSRAEGYLAVFLGPGDNKNPLLNFRSP